MENDNNSETDKPVSVFHRLVNEHAAHTESIPLPDYSGKGPLNKTNLNTNSNEEKNMKQNYTHLIIILDASGSMRSIKDDIKGSFTEFLKKQREEPGKTVFDLFQFNDVVKRSVNAADLATFHDDLMSRYKCTGCTALNDAICIAMDTIGQEFANMPEEERPEHVLCVIITDGEENASREYTTEDVKDRIEHQKTKYNWQFEFLAANQDAFETGESFGLDEDDCMDFECDSEGVELLCEDIEDRMSAIRKKTRKK